MSYRRMLAVVAAVILAAPVVHAAEFACASDLPNLGNPPCVALIGDLVTERFAKEYTARGFHIVLMADHTSYTAGGASGFALAGVVPAGASYPKDPVIMHFRDARNFDGAALNDNEKSMLRQSVAALMTKLNVANPPQKRK